MQTHLIVVNGEPRCGKDSFVDFCLAELAESGIHARKVSSVDGVKEAARILGWTDIKDDRGRKFLSDLKDLSTQAYDGPMHYMDRQMKATTATVMFFFIREPEEIDKFKQAYGHKVITLLMERNGLPQYNNHADKNVYQYRYDITIPNHGDLHDLRGRATEFCTTYLRITG